ncbi:MAG: hypothetical protein LBP19_10060 [Treponema sp.]|jgi:hypothetical protein|nr:hypothetical protein [Treponema sp.]
MRKALAFLWCLLFFSGLIVFAQEGEPEENPDEAPSDEYEGMLPSLYSTGEQTFSFTPGAVFPLFYTNEQGIASDGTHIKVAGGGGYLAYTYFLTPRVFMGGEAGGVAMGTIGENMLYIVPFGVRAGYQFTFSIKNLRFEIPVSLMAGGATQKYLETDYFGLFLKPTVSTFFRLNPDWSFGLNVGWWIIPEWTSEPRKDMIGHFLEVSLSARFHF